MKNFYEENINALIKVDPMLGASLFAISNNKRFEVFQGKDALDINILDTQTNDFLYERPLDELTKTLDDMHDKYVRYPVLFFYGIGNGLLHKALLGNESLKHLIVIEPNLEMLYIALNFIDISEDILCERIIIKISDSITFANILPLIGKKEIRPYAKIYNLHIHSNYYEKNYYEKINEVSSIFLRSYKHIVLRHGNDANDSLIGIEQHIANIPDMLKSYKTKELFKKKVSDVAIVVSTGPSLTKQLPLLKEYAPYITIISVDASLPILQKHNIVPDIVTSIERVVESASFFDNVDDKRLKDTYFVVSSLADLYTTHKLKDKKLVLSMRPLSYMIYYELTDFGYLGSGMSAANLAYQLAANMDYKDIILIGQDLAYSDTGMSHADGHKFMINKDNHKESDSYVEKYGGGGEVKTTLIWNMFKNFFESDIDEAKRCCNITTYNSTEGGARISNAIEQPFKDILETTVDKTKLKDKIKLRRVRKDVSAKLLEKANKKTQDMYEYGESLKKEVEKLFLKVAHKNEEIKKLDKKDVNYDELLEIIDEIDVIKDEVSSEDFSKMYIDTVQSYIFHQELNLAKLMVENSKTNDEKKEKLIKWVNLHQYWLFSLAGGIEAQLFAIDSGRKLLKNKANEFKFLDSLVDFDENKLKNLYCKDAIGFLAVRDNLNDKEFIKYIKELYIKFPQVIFKAFYFGDEEKRLCEDLFKNELDRFKLIIPSNIYDIASKIEIFFQAEKTSEAFKLFMLYSKNILSMIHTASLQTKYILDYSGDDFKNNIIFTQSKLLGFKETDLEKANGNILKLQFNNKLETLGGEYVLKDNNRVYDFYYYDLLDYSFKNRKFKKEIIHSNSIVWKLNHGKL